MKINFVPGKTFNLKKTLEGKGEGSKKDIAFLSRYICLESHPE